MRKQSVVLEDGVHGPVKRSKIGDVFVIDRDSSGGGGFETGNESQNSGFPEPEGPNMEKNSPDATSRSRFETASILPKDLVRPRRETKPVSSTTDALASSLTQNSFDEANNTVSINSNGLEMC